MLIWKLRKRPHPLPYDEVIVKYIPDASARLQALQSGEIDLIYGSALLTWDDYQQALSLPNIAGAVAESDSKTRNLVLNASGVLSDLKVRSEERRVGIEGTSLQAIHA